MGGEYIGQSVKVGLRARWGSVPLIPTYAGPSFTFRHVLVHGAAVALEVERVGW